MARNIIRVPQNVLIKATDGKEYILNRDDTIELLPKTVLTGENSESTASKRESSFDESSQKLRVQTKKKEEKVKRGVKNNNLLRKGWH